LNGESLNGIPYPLTLNEESIHAVPDPHQISDEIAPFSKRPLPEPSFSTATGACPGKTTPMRTLSLKPLTEIAEIWNEAERRLGVSRSHFSLKPPRSSYLPESGFLPKPTQFFEIRW
jgi:hypothetical protein